MEPTYEQLKAENERLKRIIMILQKQVRDILFQLSAASQIPGVDLENAPPPSSVVHLELSEEMKALLNHLPRQFTIEDFIITCEELELNVFRAYSDLQVLIEHRLIRQKQEQFEKTELSNQFIQS